MSIDTRSGSMESSRRDLSKTGLKRANFRLMTNLVNFILCASGKLSRHSDIHRYTLVWFGNMGGLGCSP